MVIKKFVNDLFKSNTYLIEYYLNKFLVIDPCDNNIFYKYLLDNSIELKYVFLTHEHIDHISGTNYLKKNNPKVKIVCSEYCSKAILDSKKNMSAFYNQNYVSVPANYIVNDFHKLRLLNNLELKLFPFGGHSLGGMFINIANLVFIGDQFIYNTKTVTKLPGGNIFELQRSYEFLKYQFNDETILYPGHGNKFLNKDLKIW
ncbi:MAG: MBL fold metallo-hydrolase [Flavobacteriaceae bacterium]|nr:MBL fold metallo-hydrolase [Flavobacteriaceae bacterium]